MPTEISKRINEAIHLSGYSEYKIARGIGVSQSTVHNYRKGISLKPDKGKLKDMCDFLGVSYEYIITGKGEMNEHNIFKNEDKGQTTDNSKELSRLTERLGQLLDASQVLMNDNRKNRRSIDDMSKDISSLKEDIDEIKKILKK